jgi:L-methionine (R)-S-oxide reductase
MSPATIIDGLKKELDELAASAVSPQHLMTEIVRLLHGRLPHYNWVGFYLIEKSLASTEPPQLVLGPFVGAPTPHTRIPLNEGICGAAATSGKTVVVDDVNSYPRYLACSLDTKSKIVVPIYAHGEVAGELDIDSHSFAAFKAEDRDLVEYCAMLAGKQMERVAA